MELTCIQSMWHTTFYCRPHGYPEGRVYVYSTIHTLLYMQSMYRLSQYDCLHCCTCSMYDCHVMWLSFNVKRATQHAFLAVFYYHKSVWNL